MNSKLITYNMAQQSEAEARILRMRESRRESLSNIKRSSED